MRRNNLRVFGLLAVLVLVVGINYYIHADGMGSDVQAPQEEKFGAIPGNEVNSDTLVVGGVKHYYKSGACSDATTTPFSFKSPANATSTLIALTVKGKNGTTTTDFLVGTSTLISPPLSAAATSTYISDSAYHVDTMATSSGFYFTNGTTAGAGTGFTASVGANMTRFVVGPSEYVRGYATSTYPGSSSTGLQGITGGANNFSCTYSAEFIN